uniref:Uncharacterized protein n=1 Tax=Mycena chlorophos TaxID=658473 RepID=A0ABQ0LH39_MYCCL|nr:predicted protein [Mycena chlorophos]
MTIVRQAGRLAAQACRRPVDPSRSMSEAQGDEWVSSSALSKRSRLGRRKNSAPESGKDASARRLPPQDQSNGSAQRHPLCTRGAILPPRSTRGRVVREVERGMDAAGSIVFGAIPREAHANGRNCCYHQWSPRITRAYPIPPSFYRPPGSPSIPDHIRLPACRPFAANHHTSRKLVKLVDAELTTAPMLSRRPITRNLLLHAMSSYCANDGSESCRRPWTPDGQGSKPRVAIRAGAIESCQPSTSCDLGSPAFPACAYDGQSRFPRRAAGLGWSRIHMSGPTFLATAAAQALALPRVRGPSSRSPRRIRATFPPFRNDDNRD